MTAPADTPDDRPLVSVLVPVYNEQALLEDGLAEIHRELERLRDWYRSELVIVDDGSRDRSWELVTAFQAAHRDVVAVRHPINSGLGQALRTGFSLCQGDYVVVLDADLSYHPSHIDRLVRALRESSASIAVASPYMKGGKVTGVPPLRFVLSKLANRFLAFFCPHAEVQTLTGMARAYDSNFLRQINLRGLGVEINTEILYKALLLRGRITEIPGHLDWTLQNQFKRARLSSFRVLKAIVAYLLAGFIFRPFMFFLLSGAIMAVAALYTIGWIVFHVAVEYPSAPPGPWWDDQFSVAVARVFEQKAHTFFVAGISTIVSLQLFTVGFLSYQTKHYFEELFHLNSRLGPESAPPRGTVVRRTDALGDVVEARTGGSVAGTGGRR